jgi:ADP-heptose:LPS heptosyltransferase
VAYRTLGLGDLLTVVPALRSIRGAFPRHRMALATPRSLHPLVPLIDRSIAPVAVEELGPLPPGLEGADAAVNLHGRGPESHRVLATSRPERLIGFRHPDVHESAGGAAWDEGDHEVIRWCWLLRAAGLPADPADLGLGLPAAEPSVERGATVIHPGAASAARQWPASRWAAVAVAERKAGRAVAVTGSASERPLAANVAARAGLPAHAVLAGRTDLPTLAATIAVAGRVACGDTGVAHLATAFDTPSVVVFGPTSPARWGPPPGRAHHVALWSGRIGDPHGTEPDPGLLDVDVGAVTGALEGLPDREAIRDT